MKKKVLKAVSGLLGVLVLLVGVTLLSFSLMYLAPGDPAETILRAGGSMPTEADIEKKRAEMGLDRPFLVQYGDWLLDFAHGDLGVSMIDGKNVTKEIVSSLGKSASLAAFSLIAGVMLALPLGVYTAVNKDKIFDKVTCFVVFLRLSMPSFLVGLGLLYVFAYRLKWISITSSSAGAAGLILPVVTLGTGICVRLLRQIRSLISDELKAPYVDGIRSRGVAEIRILFSHVLKNTMLPIITLIALAFGELLGGTAITEIIFSWPGIGNLVIEAIGERDYTIIQGFVVVIALIFCVIYGLTELSYGLFDPRVKKSSRRGRMMGREQRLKIRLFIYMLLASGILFITIFGGAVAPKDPYETNFLVIDQPPSEDYWFGTDNLGRCLFSRILAGARSSVSATIIIVLITAAIGTVVGMIGGYYGGILDIVIKKSIINNTVLPRTGYGNCGGWCFRSWYTKRSDCAYFHRMDSLCACGQKHGIKDEELKLHNGSKIMRMQFRIHNCSSCTAKYQGAFICYDNDLSIRNYDGNIKLIFFRTFG